VAPSAKCIWRPGSMPTNYELYYGFTRFAIELNELDPVLKDLLPPTDARFRPDQRFLEEGNLEAAAAEKQRVEELQRSRRRYMEENNLEHIPKFFKKVILRFSYRCSNIIQHCHSQSCLQFVKKRKRGQTNSAVEFIQDTKFKEGNLFTFVFRQLKIQ